MTLTIVDHPLAKHYLTVLRRQDTGPQLFRQTTRQLGHLLVAEATRDLALFEIEIETPLELTTGYEVSKRVVAVPVLRAGLGLLDAALDAIPDVRVGYVGLARNEETAEPETYYEKLPDLAGAKVLILEPMLATGGSLSDAVRRVKEKGATDVTAICVVAAPEGAARMEKDHPDVRVIVAGLDRQLNESFYIVPGLGDMGDRLFGTF